MAPLGDDGKRCRKQGQWRKAGFGLGFGKRCGLKGIKEVKWVGVLPSCGLPYCKLTQCLISGSHIKVSILSYDNEKTSAKHANDVT